MGVSFFLFREVQGHTCTCIYIGAGGGEEQRYGYFMGERGSCVMPFVCVCVGLGGMSVTFFAPFVVCVVSKRRSKSGGGRQGGKRGGVKN
jgi:hypothetical protein